MHGLRPVVYGAKATTKEMVAEALQELDSIGVREMLDRDSRPTLILDLDPDIDAPAHAQTLSPSFGNLALTTYELLWDTVCGTSLIDDSTAATMYDSFRTWAVSRTAFDDSGDIFPLTHKFFGILWTGSTVRKRWRLISGSKLDDAPDTSGRDLSARHIADDIVGSASSHPLAAEGEKGPQQVECPALPSNVARSAAGSLSTVPYSQKAVSKNARPPASSYTSSGTKSTPSLNLGADHSTCDYTAPRVHGPLPEHVQFFRSINWAATPLGNMRDWSVEVKQIVNLIMRQPDPFSLLWGGDLTTLYNEPYAVLVAGNKHPSLMGSSFFGPFQETWEDVGNLFAECARTGQAISMRNQQLFIERYGYLEETYFTWSSTPLYGSGSKVLGFYTAVSETTEHCVNHRRTHTLQSLGEVTGGARTTEDFWQRVLRGLEANSYDMPLVLLYSVVDADDGEDSELSGTSTISLKSCALEGSLGIPPGHVAAPARLDLKRSTEGFAPSFREAMRTREPTKLQTRDGTFPESLASDFQPRGFGDPCREAIVCPIRPTNGDNTMAFLLIGVNPRRTYDDGYRSFTNMLNHQLATSLASVILFEEELRRGQTAAEVATKEREQLSEQLAAQKLRMQRMAETSAVGMYYLDAYGTLVEANDRYYEMTGFSRNDDEAMSFMNKIHPDFVASGEDAWRCFTVDRVPWSGEVRLQKPWRDPATGEELENWIIATGQPEFSADGIFRSVMGSITDISRIKWAERLQNRRLEEAEETKRSTNNFLDLTSHEMRNPLSAVLHCADEIQAVLQTLETSAAAPSLAIRECMDAAATIVHCAQHQKSIVDDILTVSKLDSNLLVITPMLVQPVEVARQAVRMFETEMQKKDIRCEFLVDHSFEALEVDAVLLDGSRLLQILINLLTNAMKFTQDKSKRHIILRVGVSPEPPMPETFNFEYIAPKRPAPETLNDEDFGSGEILCLSFQVQDSGRGLTPDEKKRLFLRFSQATARTQTQYGGSGLGLFISRQLTELHGGQIGVGSEAGVGSNFAFYIKCRRSTPSSQELEARAEVSLETLQSKFVLMPRTSEPPQVVIPSPAADQKAAAVRSLGDSELHVLVVEDNIVNQTVLSRQLQRMGCSVEVADHGEHALAHIARTRYWHACPDGRPLSVVLMDLEMPVMDGLTCVKTIRQMEQDGRVFGHIPVIAVTANVRRELVATAKACGMDDVVPKPFRIPELMTKIENVLGSLGDGDI